MRTTSEIRLYLRSQVRRIWWSFGTHMTLLISAAALTGLFFYIFKDFVGDQLATMDKIWSERGLTAACIATSIVAGTLSGQWAIHGRDGKDSILSVMRRVGSTPIAIRRYRQAIVALAIIMAVICAGAAAWFLAPNWLAASCTIAGVVACIRSLHTPKQSYPHSSSPHVIADWRRHQVLYRAMPGKTLMGMGIFASAALPLAAQVHTHLLLIQIGALLCGMITTFGMIQSVAAELPGTWFEKQAGLTHDQWLKSWQHIANTLTLCLALSAGIAWSLQPHDVRMHAWALPLIAGCMPWLTPSLILQIEGRSKNLNILVATIIALFLGTAMIATPWAAAVLPLLRTQAKQYQQGRFYRA